MAEGGSPESVGDLCYLAYKEMIKRWRKEPRWTTAHNIYKDVRTNRLYFGLEGMPDNISDLDEKLAQELACKVFFQKVVMPYEDLKEKENGRIE